MNKRIFTFILTILFLVNSSTVRALNTDSENINDYFIEKGQFNFESNLRNLGFKTVYNNSSDNKMFFNLHQNDIIENSQFDQKLKDLIYNKIQDGATPLAISYSRVYLKEVQDNDGNFNFIPYTKKEITELKNSISPYSNSYNKSSPNSHNNLTLYTVAFDFNAHIVAETVFTWNLPFIAGPSSKPFMPEDYVSLSAPSFLNYSSSSAICDYTDVTGTSNRSWLHDQDYTSVVYAILDSYYGHASLKSGRVSMSVSNTSRRPLTFTSKYVHSWNKLTPSITISIGSLGVSFGLTKDQWQIANSVNLTK